VWRLRRHTKHALNSTEQGAPTFTPIRHFSSSFLPATTTIKIKKLRIEHTKLKYLRASNLIQSDSGKLGWGCGGGKGKKRK
jgi:hypothetical protein